MIATSDYLHTLSYYSPNFKYHPADGEIGVFAGHVIGPTGVRYRQEIEGEPTVADLVKPGDLIRLPYYGEKGMVSKVVKVTHHRTCTCQDPYCTNRIGNHPAARATTQFCYPLWTWTIVEVNPDAQPKKDGRYKENQYGWINECVAIGERILMLFEVCDDEVVIVKRSDPHTPRTMQPFQLSLF